MIEPVSDALTTSIRPACRAKNAMISSAMLPNVALRMPPTCGPVIEPEPLGREADHPGEPQDRRRRDDEQHRLVGVQAEVQHDRQRGSGATVADQECPRQGRELAEDRQAGPGRWLGGHAAILASARRARRVAGAAGRSPPRHVAPPRPGRSRPRPAPRPRRAPQSSAPASSSAPAWDHRPAQAPTTRTNSPRGGMRPSRRRRPAARRRPARPGRRARSSRGAWSAPGRRRRPVGTAGVGQVAQRRRDPARRLEDDRPALVGGDPREPLAPLAPGPRQEALERPARPGHPGCRDRGQHRATRRGSARPAPPSPAQAATSSPPGSLTAGVPASVTSARSAPPRRCSSSGRRRDRRRSGRGSWSSASRARAGRAAGAYGGCPRPR